MQARENNAADDKDEHDLVKSLVSDGKEGFSYIVEPSKGAGKINFAFETFSYDRDEFYIEDM